MLLSEWIKQGEKARAARLGLKQRSDRQCSARVQEIEETIHLRAGLEQKDGATVPSSGGSNKTGIYNLHAQMLD